MLDFILHKFTVGEQYHILPTVGEHLSALTWSITFKTLSIPFGVQSDKLDQGGC